MYKYFKQVIEPEVRQLDNMLTQNRVWKRQLVHDHSEPEQYIPVCTSSEVYARSEVAMYKLDELGV